MSYPPEPFFDDPVACDCTTPDPNGFGECRSCLRLVLPQAAGSAVATTADPAGEKP